jgi:DNA-binding NarL/FixJ family response regulator
MLNTASSPRFASTQPDRPRLTLVPKERGADAPAATGEARVLIATGHALLRAGYRALLDGASGISVAAEASTVDQAVSLAHWSGADVVLLDSDLPGREPVESIRELARLPRTRVIVLTQSAHGDHAFAALRAGASGFLLMDCEPDDLVRAVRAVAEGEAALSPAVTRRLIAQFAAEPDVSVPRDGLEELTDREREVMALAAHGLDNAEIGETLTVSPATAKTHVNRAMTKLRARDRAQLVAFAYETGLVTSQHPEAQLV